MRAELAGAVRGRFPQCHPLHQLSKDHPLLEILVLAQNLVDIPTLKSHTVCIEFVVGQRTLWFFAQVLECDMCSVA